MIVNGSGPWQLTSDQTKPYSLSETEVVFQNYASTEICGDQRNFMPALQLIAVAVEIGFGVRHVWSKATYQFEQAIAGCSS